MCPKPYPPCNGSFLLISIIVMWNTVFNRGQQTGVFLKEGVPEKLQRPDRASFLLELCSQLLPNCLFFPRFEQTTAANTAVVRQATVE